MEVYKVSGQYSFYFDVSWEGSFNEKSNITINGFSNRSSKLPIPCKYAWFRNGQLIENQGNIYQCCAQDIGCVLEVHVTSFEDEYDGKAIIKFQPTPMSDGLERILYSLMVDQQKVPVCAEKFNFEFQVDRFTVNNTLVVVRFPEFNILASPQDVRALKMKGGVLQQMNTPLQELQLRFPSRDERDVFISCMMAIYALRHISYRTIIDNIGQILQTKEPKQILQWIASHKICQLPTQNQVKVNMHNDDSHLLRAQNQQLQAALDNLQAQLKRQQSISSGNATATTFQHSDRLQVKNPPQINFSSPSSNDKHYREEIMELQRQVELLKQKNNSDRLNQLQSQVDQLNQENTELKKRNENVNQTQKVSDFQDQLPKKDANLIQSLQQELKTQMMVVKKLQQKIQELEGENLTLKQQLSSPNLLNQSILRQSMLTVDDQIIKQLEEKVEDAKKFNLRLKEEIERLKRKISQLQDENNELKIEQSSDLKERVRVLEKENRMLKEAKLPSPSKDSQMDNLIKQNQRLVAENQQLQKRIRELDDEMKLIQNLSQSRILTNEDAQRIEYLERENQYLTKKIEMLQRDGQNRSTGMETKQLEAQLQRAKQQIQRYQEEHTKLFDEIRQLRDQIDMQDSRVNQSQSFDNSERDRLRTQILDLQRENSQLQKENQHLQSELKRQSHKANASTSYQMQSDDSVKLLKLELENEQLRTQIKDLSTKSGSSEKEEIMLLQMQVVRLQQTNQRVMEQNTMLMEQVKKLQDELCSKSFSQSRLDLSDVVEKTNYKGWGI